MSESTTPAEYLLQRDQIAKYFYWQSICLILLTSIWFFGLGILFAILYAITIGKWLPQRQADALRYWLDGYTLRVDQGVYFLKRKAIPLDRVTDVILSQGPILRYCGLWTLNIQTAGAGGQVIPEAVLVGLENPETIRDEILKARDASRRYPGPSAP
ncbi:MAG TPA: PH domain-containing protein [Planctomycetaceae bacterium]|nr:PH domain-containing protein [Planctomycetaceae bacterium]